MKRGKRAAAVDGPRFRDSRLAKFRLPPTIRTGRAWTSAELDALLHDDPQERS